VNGGDGSALLFLSVRQRDALHPWRKCNTRSYTTLTAETQQ
jgi:hypothetical protein